MLWSRWIWVRYEQVGYNDRVIMAIATFRALRLESFYEVHARGDNHRLHTSYLGTKVSGFFLMFKTLN